MKTISNFFQAIGKLLKSIGFLFSPVVETLFVILIVMIVFGIWSFLILYALERPYIVLFLDALWVFLVVIVSPRQRFTDFIGAYNRMLFVAIVIVTLLLALMLLGAIWNLIVFFCIVLPITATIASALKNRRIKKLQKT